MTTESKNADVVDNPLARTTRSMNSSRMASRAGPAFSTSIRGRTLSTTRRVVVGAFEHRGHLLGDVAVARHHDCRPGACACQAASVVQNPLAVTTVGAAREQDDIRRAFADLPSRIVAKGAGPDALHFRAGAERGALGRRGGEVVDKPDRDHPKAAGRTGRGEYPVHPRDARRR